MFRADFKRHIGENHSEMNQLKTGFDKNKLTKTDMLMQNCSVKPTDVDR